MIPIDFPERNFVFGKPQDMTDEECSSLPVWKGLATDGYPAIISKWKLSEEDLKNIIKSGVIWLSITGNGMPPVSLFTEEPFINKQS